MQHFIPFEDDWDALANLRPEDLVPYRVGMLRDIRCVPPAIFSPIIQPSACQPPATDLSLDNG